MPFDAKTGVHDFAPLITLELLFRTEVDFVVNTARRCGLSDTDAEDVAQQVFVTLQRRLHTLHSPESVRPWLLTVTRRYARTRTGVSRGGDDGLPDDIGEIEDDVPLAEEILARSERRREALDLLESIEPSRRLVLVMHVLDEVPMREVADALGIPVATAYNRLRLARHELRDAAARRRSADEFALLYRKWDKLATVRDPTDYYYGRAALDAEAKESLWIRMRREIERIYGSIELAEADGLRVFSPLWTPGTPPLPYRRPKRQPRLPKAERLPLRDVTGSRTL
jgi:RNA polymerase sigma-70 factor (ECF subfamily)